MARSYFLISVKNEVGDRYAYVISENNYNNISYVCRPIVDQYGMKLGEVEYFCCADTKKDALATAKAWNDTWEKEGRLWNDAPIYYKAVWA